MCDSVTPLEDRFTVDGQSVTTFAGVVSRLAAAHPDTTVTEVERVVLREWEAFSASRPLVVPVGVEEGAAEMLEAGASTRGR